MPSRSYYFYSIFIIQSVIVFLGFAPSFYLKFLVDDDPYYPGGLPVPHMIHGCILTIWYIFLVAQTRWISSNNVMIHKRMGRFGAAWAAMVFLSTWWVIFLFPSRLAGLAQESNSTVAELEPNLVQILWLDVFMSILFAAFIIAGIINRYSPHIHKRVMLFSGVVFLFAASSRLG